MWRGGIDRQLCTGDRVRTGLEHYEALNNRRDNLRGFDGVLWTEDKTLWLWLPRVFRCRKEAVLLLFAFLFFFFLFCLFCNSPISYQTFYVRAFESGVVVSFALRVSVCSWNLTLC